MSRPPMSLAAVTGRFQPVHDQHLELFAQALADHDHLVVAVTNPDSGARREEATSAHRHTDAANPFTYFERLRLLHAALDGAGLAGAPSVVPFDLTRPSCGRSTSRCGAHHFVRAYSAWEKDKAAPAGRRRLRGHRRSTATRRPSSTPPRSAPGSPTGRGSGWCRRRRCRVLRALLAA